MNQKTYLFTDARHILCGDLGWFSPDGTHIRLIDPPKPVVNLHARPGWVPYGIRLAAQKAEKTDPFPVGTTLGKVIFDEGMYRSWTIKPAYPPGRNFGCYSEDAAVALELQHTESKNGYDWSAPQACALDPRGGTGFDAFTVFKDPHGKPDERYKAVYLGVPPKSDWPKLWDQYQKLPPYYRDTRLGPHEMACMYGAVSPDGIHWKALPGILMIHKSDTDTTIAWNENIRRYVMYTRLYKQNRRRVAKATSEDFYRWSPVEPLLLPPLDGPLSNDIYTNAYTAYPGLSDYHLMFPMIYHRFSQTSEVQLYSSDDGLNWLNVPGGPVVSPGRTDEWDGEFLSVGNDLVPFGPDRVALRYFATAYPHKYPRWPEVLDASRCAWAYWPKGRLSAVVADEVGEFYTHGVRPEGKELRLNVRTRKAGCVQVGLVDIPGRSADDGDPISGDGPSRPVTWAGRTTLQVPENKDVVLHFRLRAAELFGFEWV